MPQTTIITETFAETEVDTGCRVQHTQGLLCAGKGRGRLPGEDGVSTEGKTDTC